MRGSTAGSSGLRPGQLFDGQSDDVFRMTTVWSDADAVRRGVFGMLVCTVLGLGGSLTRVAAQDVSTTGTITGVVLDSVTGRPIGTALVQVLELHRQEPTHSEGQFAFRGLPPGTY